LITFHFDVLCVGLETFYSSWPFSDSWRWQWPFSLRASSYWPAHLRKTHGIFVLSLMRQHKKIVANMFLPICFLLSFMDFTERNGVY
jgi:hypothetical protein